jgi:DNA-binding IscR family transcriptional regulator
MVRLMPRGDIPEEVLNFLERRVDSVPHLEALLLLWLNPSTHWTAADISARVYVGPDQASNILADLARHGLITPLAEVSGRYTYNATWDESSLMQRVAATYRKSLVQVSKVLHAKSASNAVRDFARAFEFKPEE